MRPRGERQFARRHVRHDLVVRGARDPFVAGQATTHPLVSLRLSPSCRCSPTAEIPRVSVVIRYAAQNHWVSGSLALWRTVPEVSETWYRHLAHCHRRAPVDEHIRVPAPTALTHEPVRPTARCQILLAGLFGGELALKLAQTLGEGGPGHTPTLHIGVC